MNVVPPSIVASMLSGVVPSDSEIDEGETARMTPVGGASSFSRII